MLLTRVLVAFVIPIAGMMAPGILSAPTLSANPYAQSGIIHCWIGVQTDHIGVRQGRPSRPHFTRAYNIHGGFYGKLRQIIKAMLSISKLTPQIRHILILTYDPWTLVVHKVG